MFLLEYLVAQRKILSDEIAPVYTLVGTDAFLRESIVNTISLRLESSVQQRPETSKFYFDEMGCESAVLACESLSLFAATQLVVLDAFTAVMPNNKSKHDVALLESYLQDPVETSVLLCVVPGDKMDERKKLTKQLQKYPVVNCNYPKEDAAKEILAGVIHQFGMTVQSDALTLLVGRCGSITQAVQELRKLWTYTNAEPITIEDVRELVSLPAEDNVFLWIDAVVTGKLDVVYRSIEDLRRAGYDTFALLAMLARQFRLMWFARVLGESGTTPAAIAARVGAHPYAVKVASNQARRYSVRRLEQLLTLTADAEYAAKSGRRDAEQVLDWVILCTTRTE